MKPMDQGRRTKNLGYMMKWSSAVLGAIGGGSGTTREAIEAVCARQKLPCTTTVEGEVKYTLARLRDRGRVRFDATAKIWSKA